MIGFERKRARALDRQALSTDEINFPSMLLVSLSEAMKDRCSVCTLSP